MTDYDRGAYTPQTDAPLAFDPRRPSERRPMPMALIGSAAVLVILLAGVAMVYRGGVRHSGESPRPVGEPVMAVKTAPTAAQTAADATGSASAPAANLDVYSQGQANPAASASNAVASSAVASNEVANAAAPTFTAPAEEPAARPAPKPATVAMLSKPSAPSHIVRPSTPLESSTQPSETPATKPAMKTPAKAAAPKTVAGPTLRPASHPRVDDSELAAAGATRTVAENDAAPAVVAHKPKPSDAATAKPADAKPAVTQAADAKPAVARLATRGGAVVQIGAFSSSALADKGYADVSATLPDQMGGKAKHVQPLDKDGSTLYRTWLSGFASRSDAVAFCEALKAKGKTCLVKG